MRQVFQRSRLGGTLDDMVVRSHDRLLELLAAAERGDVNATRVAAERLAAQAGALKDLLELRITK